MKNMSNDEMIRLSKEAEKKILDAFAELASQLDWLGQVHNAMAAPITKELIHLDHEYWSETAEQFKATDLARHHYMAGEYQLAIDTLPEF